jgi:3-deoxy-D-manno-octulosonic-acid transferase
LPALNPPFLARLWAGTATLGAPALRYSLRRRIARGKEIAERLPERWGEDDSPRPDGRLLWLHAASVGETMSLLPVLSALAPSGVAVLLTTGTVTSANLLAQRLPDLGLDGQVTHRFVPLDVPAWAARFLDHWHPDAVGFVESELWPNLLAACRSRGIPMMLINGRISDNSLKAWRRFPTMAKSLLASFTRIHARGREDADRLRALGAEAVSSPGDLKFSAPALPAEPVALAKLRALIGDRPVWVAASTHPGEEEEVAAAHALLAARHPRLLTIIAPRHPERGADLAVTLRAPRRGAGEAPPAEAGIWIADTMGELGLWYRLAQAAFVGRSLRAPGGGQNPLEPARLRCPVILGPHTGNFTDPVARLREADAVREVRDAASLADAVSALLGDENARRAQVERAFAAVQLYAGLPAYTADALLGLLPAAY